MNNKKSGFTLIELVIAIGLFAVIVSIAIGGFVSALRAQRQVASLLAVNSNLSSVLEQMTREMRTSVGFCENHPDNFDCVSNPNQICFVNANDQTVIYQLSNEGTLQRGTSDPGLDCATAAGNAFDITSRVVEVTNLQFLISGNEYGDGYLPRITISASARPRRSELTNIVTDIQTTVSARPAGEG